jgi:hypothetical protein
MFDVPTTEPVIWQSMASAERYGRLPVMPAVVDGEDLMLSEGEAVVTYPVTAAPAGSAMLIAGMMIDPATARDARIWPARVMLLCLVDFIAFLLCL